jgi:hypothetical protein
MQLFPDVNAAHVPSLVPLDSSYPCIQARFSYPMAQWRVLFASLPFTQKGRYPKHPNGLFKKAVTPTMTSFDLN